MNKYRDNKSGRFTLSPATRNKKLVSELYRSFNHFNRFFAEGILPHVVITIQNRGRRNAYGWFGESFWTDGVCAEGVSEINLSAEYVSRGADALLETLLHEMAHLFNAVNEIQDCSSGQYHNKKFKLAAEKFGLEVTKLPGKGFARTRLGKEARKAISALKVDPDLFTGLKRKTAKRAAKRYASLIVSPESFDMIKSITLKTSSSQKEAVEEAIWRYFAEVDTVAE